VKLAAIQNINDTTTSFPNKKHVRTR